MGYTTRFTGAIKLSRKLTMAEAKELLEIAASDNAETMSDISKEYDATRAELAAATKAYIAAEDRLIKARRAKRDAEIAYIRETFPTRETLEAHFRS